MCLNYTDIFINKMWFNLVVHCVDAHFLWINHLHLIYIEEDTTDKTVTSHTLIMVAPKSLNWSQNQEWDLKLNRLTKDMLHPQIKNKGDEWANNDVYWEKNKTR